MIFGIGDPKPHIGDIVILDVPESSIYYGKFLYVESTVKNNCVLLNDGTLRSGFIAPIDKCIFVEHNKEDVAPYMKLVKDLSIAELIKGLYITKSSIVRLIRQIPSSTADSDLIALRKSLIDTENTISVSIKTLSKKGSGSNE